MQKSEGRSLRQKPGSGKGLVKAVRKDFRIALKRFWITILSQDIVDQWKEHLENLLKPTDTPSSEVAAPGVLGAGSPISGADVAEVVKKLLGGKRWMRHA